MVIPLLANQDLTPMLAEASRFPSRKLELPLVKVALRGTDYLELSHLD